MRERARTTLAVTLAVCCLVAVCAGGWFLVRPDRPAATQTPVTRSPSHATASPSPSTTTVAPVQVRYANGAPLPVTHPLHNELATARQTVDTPVNTTLDPQIQAAADAAVARLRGGRAATIIAVDTAGQIRAVARNAPSGTGLGGSRPLAGQFQPGSTFKIITSTAVLDSGLATADMLLPCPASTTATGRPIRNADGVGDRGTVSLRQAFAFSCNTTMVNLAVRLPNGALERAAAQYGIGVDWFIPGATSHSGRVPPTADRGMKGENAIGQGQVLVSPFAMAVVAASLAGGRLPVPILITGQPADAEVSPLPRVNAGTARVVRTFARAAVTGGTATGLASVRGSVAGKTGTAEHLAGRLDHSWFVGYRGTLGFAVFIEEGGSSRTGAVPMAKAFLTGF